MQQIESIPKPNLVSAHAAVGAASTTLVATAAGQKICVTALTAYDDSTEVGLSSNALEIRSETTTISYVGFSSASLTDTLQVITGAPGEPILVTVAGESLNGYAAAANVQVSVTYYLD